MKFGITGIGRVGGSLAFYLKEKGINFLWWTRDEKKKENLKEIIGNPSESPEEIFKECDLTFICIKDDRIKDFVENIKIKGKGKVVHTSGSLGIEVLSHLERNGFETGSFHPIQSFAEMNPFYFKNIYASFVGSENIYKILKDLFKNDVKILKINEEQKFLIHLASTISSNFFVFLLRWSERILKTGKLNIDILLPLIEKTYENVKNMGTKSALTGPAKRRDFDTIAKHENYLKEKFPEFFKIYLEITRLILKDEIS